MRLYQNLHWVGWGLFILCLALPSIAVKEDVALYGLQAGLYAVAYIPMFYESFGVFLVAVMGLGNIVSLLMPALLIKKYKYLCFVSSALLLSAFFAALTLSFKASVVSYNGTLDIGYYVWLASLLTLSIGVGSIGKKID